ncbi:MAG: hypothetical protein K5872_10510 [Rhizobiaceae bacterium]|nr:hypothetical protein [Rhizobiaceae bacterium]MCV0406648.1 hypothetical protein [Rhizobiaceae bacterium]
MADILWFIAVAGGPVLLAVLFGYALWNKRRLTPAEKAARHDAIEQLYDEDVPGMEMPEPEERHRRGDDEPRSPADLAVSDHQAERH